MSNLNTRELATVLAALRYWQWAPSDRRAREYTSVCAVNGIADNSAQSLSTPEIDALCERLNLIREIERRGAVICQWWPENVLYALGLDESEPDKDHTEERLAAAAKLLADKSDGLMDIVYQRANDYLSDAAYEAEGDCLI